jgi:phospholipid/cholesterol/gamma-HCH transport system substrate-binding protein
MRRISRSDFETLVGAAVMLAAAVALWAASAGGRAAQASNSYLLTARFDQIDGLAIGSPVFLAGIRIGSVLRIELVPGTLKPLVTVTVRSGIAIPADSAALIMSDGVLGGKFLRIEPGSETETMKPGERFTIVQDSIILEQLLQKIVQGADARRRGEAAAPDSPGPKRDAPEKKPDDKKP